MLLWKDEDSAFTVNKTNLPTELDPDFGKSYPTALDAFVVSVRPVDKEKRSLNEYIIAVLVPDYEESEYSTLVLGQILKTFLNDGDEFSARKFTDKDLDAIELRQLPMIGFNPYTMTEDYLDCFWVVPLIEDTN